MPTWQAAIFWSVSGLLVLAGAWLIIRALWLDRARGVRRCPRCWYDMSHTPAPGLTCSECGHTAKNAKKLLRTRRHWRAALAGALLLIAAAPAGIWPTVRSHGWAHVMPTTLLIYFVSTDELLTLSQQQPLFTAFGPGLAGPDPFTVELVDRVAANALWDWQLNRIIDRHLGADWPLGSIKVKHATQWPAHQPFFAPAIFDHQAPADQLLGHLRVRLRPRSATPIEPFQLMEQWPWMASNPLLWSGARLLATTGADGMPVTFDVLVERQKDFTDTWTVLRAASLTLPVTVGGTTDDYVAVDRTASTTDRLRDQARIVFDNVRGGIYFQRDESDPDRRLIIPATVQLWRGDELAHEWHALLDSDDRAWSSFPLQPGRPLEYARDVSALDRPFAPANYREYSWSVRVAGTPAFAILAPDQMLAWEGEFTIPLELVETPERLYLTSETTPPAADHPGGATAANSR